jgi:hypothetical protein
MQIGARTCAGVSPRLYESCKWAWARVARSRCDRPVAAIRWFWQQTPRRLRETQVHGMDQGRDRIQGKVDGFLKGVGNPAAIYQ